MTSTNRVSINNKIDFAVIISVCNANPNGDPLNGNRPRQTYEGFGEISDVCIKRKVRNRLQDMGESIFVQSDDNRIDDFRSLGERFDAAELGDTSDEQRVNSCSKWFDVRAFGQVFAFPKRAKVDAVSIGIRGPVTIQSAFSVDSIVPNSMQIVKSVNLLPEDPPEKKGPDTMGMKHRVSKGIYVTFGAINTQLAQKTSFSHDDANKIKAALRSLFVNDGSSARPEGSMEVKKVIWWEHNSPSGQYSSARVHRSLNVKNDGTYTLDPLPGLEPEELDELVGAELKQG